MYVGFPDGFPEEEVPGEKRKRSSTERIAAALKQVELNLDKVVLQDVFPKMAPGRRFRASVVDRQNQALQSVSKP